jgi:hypothetical protein
MLKLPIFSYLTALLASNPVRYECGTGIKGQDQIDNKFFDAKF